MTSVRAKKSLGQHFLNDAAIIEEIVDAADPSPDEVVIEVGPGTGVLTRALARRFGRVIAVEIDSHLASLLQTDLTEFPNYTDCTWAMSGTLHPSSCSGSTGVIW